MSQVDDIITKKWSRRFKWLAWVSAIYSAIALTAIFSGHSKWFDFIELIWIVVLSLPLWVTPIAKWLDMDKPIPKDEW